MLKFGCSNGCTGGTFTDTRVYAAPAVYIPPRFDEHGQYVSQKAPPPIVVSGALICDLCGSAAIELPDTSLFPQR